MESRSLRHSLLHLVPFKRILSNNHIFGANTVYRYPLQKTFSMSGIFELAVKDQKEAPTTAIPASR
jgi:hypothetical protein